MRIESSELEIASGMRSSKTLTSWTFPSVIWINEGIEPRRSRSVWSLTAALCFRNLAQGKREDTDRLWSSRRHKRFDRVRPRKDRRHKDAVLCEPGLGQSRPRFASRAFRWHGPDCCWKFLRGFPCEKVCCSWPEGRLRYRAGFPGNSTARRPSPEIDRGMKMFLFCSRRGNAGRICETPEAADAP